jgi:hypothetical protein
MLERETGMIHAVSGQGNQQRLWMRQLRVAALSMARVSLALMLVLLMVGFSLACVDSGNVAHANGLSQLTRSAELASSGLATTPTLGLTTGEGNGLASPSLSIELPLSMSGTGRGITFVLRNVTLVIKKLDLELIYN